MSNFLNIQILALSLYYIVPGVVAIVFHDLVIPSERRNWGDALVSLISYSMFNLIIYILVSPIVRLFLPIKGITNIISNLPIDYTSILIISFVLPAIVGIVSGIIPQKKFFQRLFRGALLHPVPTAWDYVFGRVKESYFILFYLKSGMKLGGLYSDKSFVSTFPQPQEIYVEEVWQINDAESWVKVSGTKGAFIKMEECSYIEFFVAGPPKEGMWGKIRSLHGFLWQKNTDHQPTIQKEKNYMGEDKNKMDKQGIVPSGETIQEVVNGTIQEVVVSTDALLEKGRQAISRPAFLTPPVGSGGAVPTSPTASGALDDVVVSTPTEPVVNTPSASAASSSTSTTANTSDTGAAE